MADSFQFLCPSTTGWRFQLCKRHTCIYVEVPDSNAVSQIELTLGSDATQTDIFNHTFDYDVTIGMPSGFSFSRIGNKVYLGLGTFLIHQFTMPKFDSKNSSGAWSDYYEFYGN
ncbi:MAG: hypothetical protein IPG39_03150 [Bacteroidetes bacterium]|nr:hypothetical protein [Bacteroidota bacterium]